MARTRRSELTAGLLVVGGLAAALGVILWLGAADVLKTRGQLVTFYSLIADGSLGLAVGTEVACADARIGRLVEVQPAPDQGKCFYRARLERADLTIRRDAEVVVVGPFVGQPRIIVLGFGKAAELADDANPVRLGGGGIEGAMQQMNALARTLKNIGLVMEREMDSQAADSLLAKVHGMAKLLRDAAEDVQKLAANVRNQTDPNAPDTLMARIRKTAGDINLASGSLAEQMDARRPDAALARIRKAAANIEGETDAARPGSVLAKVHGAMDDLGGMVKDGRPKVEGALAALADTAKRIDAYTKDDLAKVFQAVHEALPRLRKIIEDVAVVSEHARQIAAGNRYNIDETIDNLAAVSAEAKSAAKEIRRNPWRLFYEPKKDEQRWQTLYDAARSFADGAERIDRCLARLQALRDLDKDDPALKESIQGVRKGLDEALRDFSDAEKALWKELKVGPAGGPATAPGGASGGAASSGPGAGTSRAASAPARP